MEPVHYLLMIIIFLMVPLIHLMMICAYALSFAIAKMDGDQSVSDNRGLKNILKWMPYISLVSLFGILFVLLLGPVNSVTTSAKTAPELAPLVIDGDDPFPHLIRPAPQP
jgi:preprotein translocase subunit SecG